MSETPQITPETQAQIDHLEAEIRLLDYAPFGINIGPKQDALRAQIDQLKTLDAFQQYLPF